MLATLRGEPTEMIPWVPRLDLWYNANKRAGTLPGKYKSATLADITDDLDWGYHAVIPQFKDIRDPADEVHRPLGIYNLWNMPYESKLENVAFEADYQGDETTVMYQTPVGSIRTGVLYDETMCRAGITISHITDHAIKSPQDYRAVGYIFDNTRVVPNYDGYEEFSNRVGDRGLATAFVSLAGSPMHLLQRELMPMDLFFFELHDNPDLLAECAESIGRYFERVLEVIAECPAEMVLFGANYDAMVTYPPFFREHILPWLSRFAEKLHQKGKFLLTHTDGENSGLLDYYLESGIDVADSVCPKPMTKLSLKQVRDHFAGRINIMGGIPSVCLLRDSMSDQEFDTHLERVFSDLGRGDHLILGISDTTPPAADFGRLKRVSDLVRRFGSVSPTP